LSTSALSPPILPSTPPISTQEILQPQAETSAVASEREKRHMHNLMQGTRQAGALAAVRTFNFAQSSLYSCIHALPQEFLRVKTSNAAVNEMLM
jgi:hypothetical protein